MGAIAWNPLNISHRRTDKLEEESLVDRSWVCIEDQVCLERQYPRNEKGDIEGNSRFKRDSDKGTRVRA